MAVRPVLSIAGIFAERGIYRVLTIKREVTLIARFVVIRIMKNIRSLRMFFIV